MIQNDALCEACCRQHGRIFETCNNGCHIRDLFEKLTAERDAAVADLTKIAKNCMTCKHTTEMDDDLCVKCARSFGLKYEWRSLSLTEKTSDKEEKE